MIDHADFIAELKYRTTEQGGRRTPAYSFIGTDSVKPAKLMGAKLSS